MSKAWFPTQLEQKCLRQLDAPGSWQFLKVEPPEATDILRWRPFRRIFVFNFSLFALIMFVFFLLLERSVGGGVEGVQDDLPYGLGATFVLALALGFYSTHLYRRSWNRRARSLTRE